MPEPDSGTPLWQVIAAFLLVSAPVYLLMRVLVKLVRQAYGFQPAPPDDGPPLRICQSCQNTVMESDFSHCPSCGAPLPETGPGTAL
jgi:hypothetical protein